MRSRLGLEVPKAELLLPLVKFHPQLVDAADARSSSARPSVRLPRCVLAQLGQSTRRTVRPNVASDSVPEPSENRYSPSVTVIV